MVDEKSSLLAYSTPTADNSKLDFDIVIIGAGISGLNAAYRVQTQSPAGTRFAVFEARNDIGGTWSFFKYPGIRSDSDLHTFGFQWRPWNERRAIADAASIMQYLRDSAREGGIEDKVRLGHRLIGADWSSKDLCWTMSVDVAGEGLKKFRTRFMIIGTGYYDYEEALPAIIPGLENFKGTVVHPQFWPEDLDYENKTMVVVGSGATAITLLPNLAEKAKHVTMLQRSPSYILPLPAKDRLGAIYHSILPEKIAWKVDRMRFMVVTYLFFYFCRTFPNAARGLLKKATTKELPTNVPWDPHFKPSYNPWEQRMCISPDGDFFTALKSGKAGIVTDKIKKVTATTIELETHESISPDIIVTATGLKIHLVGGAKFTVDGKKVNLPDKYVWKGVMLQDLPNAAMIVGYTNASWTLGADAATQLILRLLKVMRSKGAVAIVPRVGANENMTPTPMLNISSTYIQRALNTLPKTGQGQWAPRENYFRDMREVTRGDVETGLEFMRSRANDGKSVVSEKAAL